MSSINDYKYSTPYLPPPSANTAPPPAPMPPMAPPPPPATYPYTDGFESSPPNPYAGAGAPPPGGYPPPGGPSSSQVLEYLTGVVTDLNGRIEELLNPGGGTETGMGGPPMTADGRPIPQQGELRPEGDIRTPGQIVDGSPALSHLGRQKDINFEQLCAQTGVDPKLDVKDPNQNPDAVYRLAKVLDFIDAPSVQTGNAEGKEADGSIAGMHEGGNAEHGTEAGMVKDFAEQGYEFLNRQYMPAPTTPPVF